MSDPSPRRITIGSVPIDAVTMNQAIERIVVLAKEGRGGTVYTPNVDHVVVASENAEFQKAYDQVSLSLVDGTPVFWASRLFGKRLPEKVSGSDLFEPLLERAAKDGLAVYFFGGQPGVAELARDRLTVKYPGLRVVGLGSPKLSAAGELADAERWLKELSEARPNLLFVACGAPKSELFCYRYRDALTPAVLVCVGAAIDFSAGTLQRAPAFLSKIGLEWAYRLLREPRRLARRYLLRDPKFFWLLARQLLTRGG